MKRWANERLRDRGKVEATEDELHACLRLELAMPLARLNEIEERWPAKEFPGQSRLQASDVGKAVYGNSLECDALRPIFTRPRKRS